MNYWKTLSISISTSLLLIVLIFVSIFVSVEKKTEEALKDYSMLPDGIKVVDKAILGRRERTLSKGLRRAYLNEFGSGNKGIFRRGAISLICTNQNNVLLLVQDYKPEGDIGKGFFRGSDNTASKYGHGETKISNMTYLSRGYFDTYVSDPLSEEEIASIVEILTIEDIVHIAIIAFDGGDAFAPEFNLSEVKQLINGRYHYPKSTYR